MNLKRVLDDYYRKVLKVHGISISDRRLNEEELEEFMKEIYLVGIDIKIVQDILEIIENYQREGDSTMNIEYYK